MRIVICLISCCAWIMLIACTEDQEGEVLIDQVVTVFEDGFESAIDDFTDLFPQDRSRWSNVQVVNSESGENEIGLSQDIVLSGRNSLRIFSNQSQQTLSKVDIEKGELNLTEGSMVTIEANFYITTTSNIKDIFLMDLECCSCWDPDVADNQCPGIRLIMSGDNDFLSIERGKILEPTILQADVPFPRNEWVKVKWEMVLSPEIDGSNKLYINDLLVISSEGINMPNAESFRDEFAKNGIDFQLQEPLFYERVQIGVTANASLSDIEMYVDDVEIVNVK
ncbi:MAG: hypothetical protein AAFQ94_17410 [Bacteroidota bacterium]